MALVAHASTTAQCAAGGEQRPETEGVRQRVAGRGQPQLEEHPRHGQGHGRRAGPVDTGEAGADAPQQHAAGGHRGMRAHEGAGRDGQSDERGTRRQPRQPSAVLIEIAEREEKGGQRGPG